jgi:hypothetical protein
MAQQYDNTNRGSIWKNDKKETDNHPDFTGTLNVDGIEFWVSAWKRKEGADPKAPALSFTVRMKEEKPQQKTQTSKTVDDFEDDIPY